MVGVLIDEQTTTDSFLNLEYRKFAETAMLACLPQGQILIKQWQPINKFDPDTHWRLIVVYKECA